MVVFFLFYVTCSFFLDAQNITFLFLQNLAILLKYIVEAVIQVYIPKYMVNFFLTLNWSLYCYNKIALSFLVLLFVLKSTLGDINISILAFFSIIFHCGKYIQYEIYHLNCVQVYSSICRLLSSQPPKLFSSCKTETSFPLNKLSILSFPGHLAAPILLSLLTWLL